MYHRSNWIKETSVYFSIMQFFKWRLGKINIFSFITIIDNSKESINLCPQEMSALPNLIKNGCATGVLWEMILYGRHQLVWGSTVIKPIKTSLTLWHSIIQSQDTFYQRQQININRICWNWHWNIFISFISSNYAKIKYTEWIIIECELN